MEMSHTQVSNSAVARASHARAHRGAVRDRERSLRRLLVISFHYPPDGAVGGWRWAGLAKYLARRGWEVHVVTAAAQDAAAEPGVHVHTCARARTLNDAYNEWATRRRVSGPYDMVGAARTTTTPPRGRQFGLLRAIRKNVAVSLALPDIGRGWILRAAATARALLRAQTFDAVVSSGPPHSAHLAAMLACAGRRVPRWVDLRDPWAATLAASAPRLVAPALGLGRLLVRGLEWLVFHNTHYFVTNTPEFAEHMRSAYPRRHVACVPNGIDLDRLPATPPTKFSGLSIAYAGTLYLKRNLSLVLSALRAFLDRNPLARSTTRLRIAGAMEGAHAAAFWRDVDAAQLGDCVEALGHLSPSEAVELVHRSHLALVLAQDQPAQIPAKLYECAGLRVPTLVIAEAASAATREARRLGALTCEPDDAAHIERVLEALWRDRDTVTPPRGAIGYDTIAAQMDALLSSAATVPATSLSQHGNPAPSTQ